MSVSPIHGSRRQYRLGCRCATCVASSEVWMNDGHVGSPAKYRSGCRCDPCRVATYDYNLQRVSAWRARRVAMVAGNTIISPLANHGRATYITWACRCDVCRGGQAEYSRSRSRAQGRPERIPVGPRIHAPREGCECRPCQSYAEQCARHREQNSRSRERATNFGKQWTSAELQVVFDSREPSSALAAKLQTKRHQMKVDPRLAPLIDTGSV
jgi:hypothetical protein